MKDKDFDEQHPSTAAVFSGRVRHLIRRWRKEHAPGSRLWWPLAVLLLAAGCGDDPKKETPYGSVDQVDAWRRAVDPLIDRINDIDAQFRAEAVGSANQATAENLAAVLSPLRPQLAQVLTDLEGIEPPPLLAPVHGDIHELIVLRLTAYQAVLDGWQLQQEGNLEAAETHYAEAEEGLATANALGAELNDELLEVDVALGAEPEGNPIGQRAASTIIHLA